MAIAPPNPPFIQARDENVGGSQPDPTLIVMHATVTSDNAGTARNIARRWQTTVTGTSAHYLRDARECVQAVGDHTVAYHCGYNTGSVGYEMCDEQVGPVSRWSDADSTAIIKGSARDVARLGLAYGIPLRRLTNTQLRAWADAGKPARLGGIVSHEQMSQVFKKSTHSDPRDFPWTKFMSLVQIEKKALLAGEAIKPDPNRYLHTILWNAKVTMNESFARSELFEVLDKRRPMTVMLQEIDWTVGNSDYVGFRGDDPEADQSTVLLVRKDLKILEHGVHHMTKGYTGPHGHPKAPRQFPWARIQVGPEVVRAASIHMPATSKTNPAWIEADEYLTKVMRGTNPIVYGGDWNATGTSLPGTQYGSTIDHLRLVNAVGVSQENLGPHGSDHAMRRMVARL